jgi:glucokinase
MANSPTSEWILGLDIGGTTTSAVAGQASGQIFDRRTCPSHAERGFAAMWEMMTAAADELVNEHGRPSAVGVSIGGPVSTEQGIVHSPPNLPGWDDVPLKDRLRGHFGVPVYVEHDARAGAVAEWLFGAARGCRNVVFLTFGTGLGAGLILDGRLYRGTNGLAGEVGHWRMSRRGPSAYGKPGSWEALSSGSGLPRLARHLYPGTSWPADMSAATLASLARSGDVQARHVIHTSATWLGRGIAHLVDLLSPDIVVLGGLAVYAGDLFLPTARKVLARECAGHNGNCPIEAAQLGTDIGNVAALCAALYQDETVSLLPGR